MKLTFTFASDSEIGDPFDISSETPPELEASSKQPSSSRSHSYQSALDSFLPKRSGKEPSGARSEIDELASKIGCRVAEQLGHNFAKETTTTTNPIATLSSGNTDLIVKANNLVDILEELPEFQLSHEENSRILRCFSCAEFFLLRSHFRLRFVAHRERQVDL